MKIIPYGKQTITNSDISAVVKVLKSDFLTQGPSVLDFETKFSKYVNSKHSIAVSNGTAALHLACIALAVKKGTNVITTSLTFSATANCIKYLGGTVWFVDIDPKTYLIDLKKVNELINSKPKGFFSGIIPVHFAGRPVNMEKLKSITTKNSMWIIEDACHAPGAYFYDKNSKKQKIGNSKYSEFTIFSFHPVKHLTTGEGGILTTNSIKLYQKVLKLRSHGIERNSNNYINSIETAIGEGKSHLNTEYPGWYMEMQELGYNYRICDIQAALGSSQLKNALANLNKRIRIVKRYDEAFLLNKNILKFSNFEHGHSYHLYIIEIKNRLGLYNFLKKRGIYTQVHYFPVHMMPYYQNIGNKQGDLPLCEKYYKHCLSLPIYPTLSIKEQKFVIDSINEFYQ